MKTLSRILFGKVQLRRLRSKRAANHEERANQKVRQAQEKEQKRVNTIVGAQKYPELRLTLEEYLQIKPMPKKLDGQNIQQFPLGTLLIGNIPQVVLMVVKRGDLFCDQWGAGLSGSEIWANHYKVSIVEIIRIIGPKIPGIPAKRITEIEWKETISLKGKADNFLEEACKKQYAFPAYFRTESDFLLQVEKNEEGRLIKQILLAEIIQVVKPYNPQTILKEITS
jgi:hypothetical protein